jgi:hypothetical protein
MRVHVLTAHNFPGRNGSVAYTVFIPKAQQIPPSAKDAIARLGGKLTAEEKKGTLTIVWLEKVHSAKHARKRCIYLEAQVRGTLLRF